jgi:hypothetical protein
MNSSNIQYKQPILPEGCEVWISAPLSLVVWWLLFSNNYPIWVYIPVVVLVFLAFVLALNTWTDADRMRAQAIKMLRNQIQPNLANNIRPFIRQIDKPKIAALLRGSADVVEQIAEELVKQEPGIMLGGMSEVNTEVARLAGLIPEYVDIQDHPAKAGEKFDQQMAEGETGIAGFNDWATDMLARVNRGDIFKMSTNARLLATLRNMFSVLKSPERKGD